MENTLKELKEIIAASDGKILPSAAENLNLWLSEDFLPEWALKSLLELFRRGEYDEINDRFFRPLAFGTGGMRGRTIGKAPAYSELGEVSPQGTPAHAAVGANNMNDFTVVRATMGLFNYCKNYLDSNGGGVPKLVVAHDVRHFSKRFCELAATVWSKMGGEVFIFDGARSTPQLSFTVRHLKTTAGIVITASHNPSHDNGYKVYFSDGAQAISPHAEGIVAEVNKVAWNQIKPFLEVDLSEVKRVDKSAEDAYVKSIENCVIDKEVMAVNKPKAVFTAVHGTGATLCPTVMRHFGLEPVLVDEQMVMDPRFPTVKQPNPEYAATLSMGISKMRESGAEGLIVEPKNCTLIKTFVTTPLQDKIAESHGLKCINTLTGFKWIGGRLTKYEEKLNSAMGKDCSGLSYLERAKLLQEHSTFFVFGGEESYGYLGTDSVRDKDANAAVIMFCEMLAYLKSQNMTVDEYLDSIYLKCGYYLEDLKSIYREGASGASEIQAFLKVLDECPLVEVGGVRVAKSVNFAKDRIVDADGIEIPKEKFFFYTLENGYSFAVRASGTEPKIKFYAFAKEDASGADDLPAAKERARAGLDKMLAALEDKFLESVK